jgi:hypothetical protein
MAIETVEYSRQHVEQNWNLLASEFDSLKKCLSLQEFGKGELSEVAISSSVWVSYHTSLITVAR